MDLADCEQRLEEAARDRDNQLSQVEELRTQLKVLFEWFLRNTEAHDVPSQEKSRC